MLINQPRTVEEVEILLDPILRHGRDNISFLYSADAFDLTIIALYFAILILLAISGIYRIRMIFQFWRYLNVKPVPLRQYAEEELPRITIQLPLYNELFVVERLLEYIVKIDYPAHLLEIQVLDDSTDDTSEIARREVERYAALGIDICYTHRTDRTGFKAGALENGMKTAKGELIAIFDADFTPQPDCLRRMVHFFTDESIGMTQMRWGHINGNYSLLTFIQQMILDGHMVVEQTARCRTGAFFNFNGTAGMWRKKAIEWSGGWQHDTLTEDSDLSFRAQLMGWRFVYLLESEVPAELPVEMNAFKAQQRRWAKGMVQVGVKLLPRIWRNPELPMARKMEMVFRLLGNLSSPLVILLCFIYLPTVVVRYHQGFFHMFLLDVPLLLLGTLSMMAFYGSAVIYLYPHNKWRLLLLPLLMSVGIGLVLSNSRAAIEGLLGIKSEFVRTPKYNVEKRRDNWLRIGSGYRRRRGVMPYIELAFAFYFAFVIYYAIRTHIYGTIPFLLLFLFGFGYVSLMSLFQGALREISNQLKARFVAKSSS
ncbi:MAG: glycosyltransferase [Acidobacteria bacterium]|nr:glycosyltransferase [Acidobacteriota bacterium]